MHVARIGRDVISRGEHLGYFLPLAVRGFSGQGLAAFALAATSVVETGRAHPKQR